MPLQGEAKKLYQRGFISRLRAGEPTRTRPPPAEPAPPKRKPTRCWWCGEDDSDQRIMIGNGLDENRSLLRTRPRQAPRTRARTACAKVPSRGDRLLAL